MGDRFAVRRGRHAGDGDGATRLLARLAALDGSAELARGRVPDGGLADVEGLLAHADARFAADTRYTVVALAGATGSGKSSLFNALTGLDLAETGARRPTTRTTLACAWDPEGAGRLLDLVGVEPRNRVARHGPLDGRRGGMPSGLVLLDLPDHDSIDVSHRAEVDAVVAVADHIVWVLDPQKYADALVHERYLRRLRHHGRGMTVVLNHADRLTAAGLAACTTDVRALLAADGLAQVRVIATSPETGMGVAELRRVVVAAAGDGEAAVVRLAADLDALTERLDPYFTGVVPAVDAFGAGDRARLVDALCDAAGVGVVAEASGEALRTPLGPLWGRAERAPVWPAPVQIHRAEQAIRRAGAALTRGMPSRWTGAVHEALAQGMRRLPQDLDAALVAPLPDAAPAARTVGVAVAAQWVGLLAVVAGFVGAVFALTGVPTPRWWGIPGPTWVVLAGSVLLGTGAWFGRRAAVVAASRRAGEVAELLRGRVRDAADRLLVEPAEAELDRYREAHDLFVAARAETT